MQRYGRRTLGRAAPRDVYYDRRSLACYAAGHDGKLPASLEKLRDVTPIPLDC